MFILLTKMVKIKKVNEKALTLWKDNYGFAGDKIKIVTLPNGSNHFRKCNSGTFCGKDCYEMDIQNIDEHLLNILRKNICKHCLVYIDELLKRRKAK